ncbi:PREDICTED: uncharacterized protein LOC108565675 [Nicrophorus vespilloides]|uniref:Uncharacterized protein LOC108565675 n=1 Tax=Nicrophorus vespilloides TaxID=110193 RepID=A0ABM1N1N6_NICVS|nr:PREDICTED: uncharacterized protein LOC108565675 [Nicrophorus vespilloides]
MGAIRRSLVLFFATLALASASPSPIKRTDPKKDHCNKTVDIYDDVSSPEVTPDNVGKPMTCWYRFRSFRGTPKDWILRIKFNKFKVGTLLNASHCEGGYMQVNLTKFLFPPRKIYLQTKSPSLLVTNFTCINPFSEFVRS